MNFMDKLINCINERNKNLINNLKNLTKKTSKNSTQRVQHGLVLFVIGILSILSISRVVVEATSSPKAAPDTHTVIKYDIKNRIVGKFVYNKKGYLYESRVYNPETKKVKALRYFYKNTGRMSSRRLYDNDGKLQRLDTYYNVANRKQALGKTAHSVIYKTKDQDTKGRKIVKEINFTPKGKPVAVGKFIEPIKNGKSSITSGFGSGRAHTGLDMAYNGGGNTYGKPIYAANAGRVVEVEKNSNVGYGNHVIIDHGNGIRTLYGHMSHVDVNVGQIVWKNQKIGNIGSTGISTGPHVHFEYRIDNQPINGINRIREAIFYLR